MSTETTNYRVKLKDRFPIAEGTLAFQFEKPVGFNFKPGQWTDKEMLARHLGAVESPIYYVVGPPGMVKGMQEMLNESRIDDDDSRTEGFSGY